MKYIVGAYATAPSTVKWNSELESQYYYLINTLKEIKGIEHPFIDNLHPFDDEWFLQNINPNWEFVFTSIPGVMAKLSSNKAFGIASNCEAGRLEALTFYRKLNDAVHKLNGFLKRQAVSFIKIHTSPVATENNSSINALIKSLETLVSWNWEGASLVIEHCDAYIKNQRYEKGFMTLEDEILAVSQVNKEHNTNIGISINWGRSAIETRDTLGPIDHIKKASESRLLRGLIFSGVCDKDGPYGVWKDSHVPPRSGLPLANYEARSLLTIEEISRSLASCGWDDLSFVGGKISVKPDELNVQDRVAHNQNLLSLISLAQYELSKQASK